MATQLAYLLRKTLAGFVAWDEGTDMRYELVGGFVVAGGV